jgi:hypothetical protein
MAVIGTCVLLTSFLSGCATPSEIKTGWGEEASLKAGQTVVIEGGKLNIEFLEVVEDSRCPRNVTCIWQGQAVCSLQITPADGSMYNLDVTEPGLSEGFSEAVFQDYLIYFHLKPYPERGGEITKDEYRLDLAAIWLKTPVNTEADVTGVITNVESVGEKDIIGRISVESDTDKLVEKYVVTVTKDTGLFRQTADELESITLNALEDQQQVKLWLAGPVMESYPMQATASRIVVTGP